MLGLRAVPVIQHSPSVLGSKSYPMARHQFWEILGLSIQDSGACMGFGVEKGVPRVSLAHKSIDAPCVHRQSYRRKESDGSVSVTGGDLKSCVIH